MKASITRMPNFMKNPKQASRYAEQAFRGTLMQTAQSAVVASGGTVKEVNSNRMTATIKQLSRAGVIDLKPFFKASSKAKKKKNGGWYMVIPISMQRRTMQSEFGSGKAYNEMKSSFSDLAPGATQTLNIAEVLNGVRSNQSLSQSLIKAPTASSGNITATKSQTGKRTSYVAFRTVSDRSTPNSWVVGKKNVSEDNTSKTFQDNIKRLMNQRIRQLQKG